MATLLLLLLVFSFRHRVNARNAAVSSCRLAAATSAAAEPSRGTTKHGSADGDAPDTVSSLSASSVDIGTEDTLGTFEQQQIPRVQARLEKSNVQIGEQRILIIADKIKSLVPNRNVY